MAKGGGIPVGKFVAFIALLEVLALGMYASVIEFAEDTTLASPTTPPSFLSTHTLVVVVFPLLLASLRKYTVSGLAFTLFLAVLCLPWAFAAVPFFSSFLEGEWEKSVVSHVAMVRGEYVVCGVLVASAALVGRVNALQLVAIAFAGVVGGAMCQAVNTVSLKAQDHGGNLVVHVFGGAMGLAASVVVGPRHDAHNHPDNQGSRLSHSIALIGSCVFALALPPFASALVSEPQALRLSFNIVLALSSGTATAIATSLLAHNGMLDVADVQRGALAGGVAIAGTGGLLVDPWVGVLAGIIGGAGSVACLVFVSPKLSRRFGMHDTAGALGAHFLPGLIHAVICILATMNADATLYSAPIALVFPERAPSAEGSAELLGVAPGDDRTASEQAASQFFALLASAGLGLGAGVLGGVVARSGLMQAPVLLFDDHEYWIPQALDENASEEGEGSKSVVRYAESVL